jgi:hypothetical protein
MVAARPGGGAEASARDAHRGPRRRTGTIARLESLRGGFPPTFLALLEIRRPPGRYGTSSASTPSASGRSAAPARSSAGRHPRQDAAEHPRWHPAVEGRSGADAAGEGARHRGPRRRGAARARRRGSCRGRGVSAAHARDPTSSARPGSSRASSRSSPRCRGVLDVVARAETRATVRHQEGVHVDLRVVEPAAFGAALANRDHPRAPAAAPHPHPTGTECDILADGSLDLPDELLAACDVVLGAVHSRHRQDRQTR